MRADVCVSMLRGSSIVLASYVLATASQSTTYETVRCLIMSDIAGRTWAKEGGGVKGECMVQGWQEALRREPGRFDGIRVAG